MNPLIPGASDVLWASAVILNALLVVAALITLARATDKRRWLSTLLFIVFVPFVGPIMAIMTAHGSKLKATRASESDTASA
ncbi:MAG: hypothetical protein QM630_00985 [Microbacterium sp.]